MRDGDREPKCAENGRLLQFSDALQTRGSFLTPGARPRIKRPAAREAQCDYMGFEIPDEFVVGYGIDYAQRNRNLPPLKAVTSPEEYQARANAAITKYMAFLKDREILSVEPYLDPAMRAHIGVYVPEERREFFTIANQDRKSVV